MSGKRTGCFDSCGCSEGVFGSLVPSVFYKHVWDIFVRMMWSFSELFSRPAVCSPGAAVVYFYMWLKLISLFFTRNLETNCLPQQLFQKPFWKYKILCVLLLLISLFEIFMLTFVIYIFLSPLCSTLKGHTCRNLLYLLSVIQRSLRWRGKNIFLFRLQNHCRQPLRFFSSLHPALSHPLVWNHGSLFFRVVKKCLTMETDSDWSPGPAVVQMRLLFEEKVLIVPHVSPLMFLTRRDPLTVVLIVCEAANCSSQGSVFSV